MTIRVTNLSTSVEWYERLLGTISNIHDAGNVCCSIVLYENRRIYSAWEKRFYQIDHFAFKVDAENFAKAKAR